LGATGFLAIGVLGNIREDRSTSISRDAGPAPFTFVLSDVTITRASTGNEFRAVIGRPLETELELSFPIPGIGTNLVGFSRAQLRALKPEGGNHFLNSLASALGATNWTASAQKTNAIQFNVAIMGTNLYRGKGRNWVAAQFTSDLPGNWIVTKAFFGDGDLECYLAIEPTLPVGMFYQKDDESGPGIVAEVSRLFDLKSPGSKSSRLSPP
jgi:hypothetical protein